MSIRWSFRSNLWEPTRSELATISSIIQPEEKARIAKFHFIKDAKSSLIGRLLIRKLINIKTGTPNHLIQLARDKNNKPIVLPPNSNENSNSNSSESEEPLPGTTTNNNSVFKNLNFNVSHQGDFVVLASDPSALQLGIDVMNIEKPGRVSKNVDEYFRLMNRQFTSNEWDQICNAYGTISDKQKMTNFTRFWALKESYVKAIGVGIVIDLRTIDFRTKSELVQGEVNTETKVVVDKKLDLNWDFEERFLDYRHIVAVAKERRFKVDNDEEANTQVDNIIPDFKDISLDYLLEDMTPLGDEDHIWVDKFLAKK